jgi:large repetitive protein
MTASAFVSAPIIPPVVANHIVISEIQITEGSGKTTHDFIELYNPTANPIDINGYRIVKRASGSTSESTIKSWTTTTIIAPYSYYLWVSSSDNTFSLISIANATTNASIAEDTSVAFKKTSDDSIIDSVGWGNANNIFVEGTSFLDNPTAFQSIERKAYTTSHQTSMMIGADMVKGNGFDSNNNSNDFILRTMSQPQNSSSSAEIP